MDYYENFIALSRYARWIPEENRRETWTETVDRYVDNVVAGRVSKNMEKQIRSAIHKRDVMPSMRGLMTAGAALDRENLALYNCSAMAIDSPRCFDEALYILMNGVGLGFSVEQEFVSQLPVVNEHFENSESTIMVADTKAGWARGFRELVAMLYAGQIPHIDTSNVRPAGARLKTFGGRASGPEPLVELMNFTIDMFMSAKGRKLTPLECHDLMCKIGQVVVVGGVRRSALISLSDLGNYEMATAKSGAWWEHAPHRALANNSAAYNSKPPIGEFLREWSSLYESKSGERGIFNRGQHNSLAERRDMSRANFTNPCGEILLRHGGLCNLSEVIIRPEDDLPSLIEKVKIATTLGTIQSTMTRFKYLRRFWANNAEEERLLGVSLTGQYGNKLMSGQLGLDRLGDALDQLRRVAIETNERVSAKLGITPSTAITTVKPSGTVSQLTGSSSGMHPWHAPYYLRAVRGDNKDPLTQFLSDAGIPSESDHLNPEHQTVFYFPIRAPDDAVCRKDITAIDHLKFWQVYKTHWTEHNPSTTISVQEDEWVEVANWVYQNWESVGGLSFLPYSEHTYKQAPYQEIDEVTYKQMVAKLPENIDWDRLREYETEDTTSGSQELACTADACEIVDITK